MPSKARVVEPHAGKSSQKMKEAMHPDVMGELVIDPKTNIQKDFIYLSTLNNHVSLAHQPLNFEA